MIYKYKNEITGFAAKLSPEELKAMEKMPGFILAWRLETIHFQTSELTGSWKVFGICATPIHGEERTIEETNVMPYVYLCMENLKKRTSRENLVYFREEEVLDIQGFTVLWLPGGVTAYVDVDMDGILCIGVGWYSDEGINLVMERDYGLDGKFKEVRWKSEMKRRWTNPPPM